MFTTQRAQTVSIPPKRLYQHQEFVGRRKELGEVARRVAQGKQGKCSIDFPVINFWGIEGSGKSWLVRHLARLYRGPGRLRQGEQKRTFTAVLDFAGLARFEWTPSSVAALLQPAIAEIAGQVGDTAQEAASRLQARVEAAIAGQETAEALSRSFVDWIIGLTDQFVPIILLDSIERATPEALEPVELHLIEPLVSTDRIILITAGRRKVARWRRFAVRRRQDKPIALEAFTPLDTASQIQKQGFDLPGELVYDYSFGLAYASQVLAAAIRELTNGHKVDRRFLQENEHRLGPWLAALDEHLLQTVPPELRETLHVLCVLRAIREGALPYLLPSRKGEYRDLLDELETTRLVWWDPDRGVYLMAPSLRRLLNLYLQLQEPADFARYHRQAAEYYSQAIQAKPYDCGLFLVEALYHMAYGYADQLSRIAELLALDPDNFTVGGADLLLEQLTQDDELLKALPDPWRDEVIQKVQGLRRQVRRMRLSVS